MIQDPNEPKGGGGGCTTSTIEGSTALLLHNRSQLEIGVPYKWSFEALEFPADILSCFRANWISDPHNQTGFCVDLCGSTYRTDQSVGNATPDNYPTLETHAFIQGPQCCNRRTGRRVSALFIGATNASGAKIRRPSLWELALTSIRYPYP